MSFDVYGNLDLYKGAIWYAGTMTTSQVPSYHSTCWPGLQTEMQVLVISFESMKTVHYTPDFNVNVTGTDSVTYSVRIALKCKTDSQLGSHLRGINLLLSVWTRSENRMKHQHQWLAKKQQHVQDEMRPCASTTNCSAQVCHATCHGQQTATSTYSTIGPSITTSPPKQWSWSNVIQAVLRCCRWSRSWPPSVVQEEMEYPLGSLFEEQGAGCRHGFHQTPPLLMHQSII